VARRNGFTLIETLIAIVIVGLLALIAYPKISAARITSDLRSGRTALINAVAMGRTAAMQSARTTFLKFEGNNAIVLARPRRVPDGLSDADTIGAVLNLAEYRVSVTSSADSIRFNPGGLGADLGAGQTIVLSHGSHSESIQIDGLGRVTK
jgi:prepilin-type N-terminal cleavage/methylation domain-containing protein